MLAEIFLLHLEATARAAKEAQVAVVGSSCEPAHPGGESPDDARQCDFCRKRPRHQRKQIAFR
jgi:hypothetical protein